MTTEHLRPRKTRRGLGALALAVGITALCASTGLSRAQNAPGEIGAPPPPDAKASAAASASAAPQVASAAPQVKEAPSAAPTAAPATTVEAAVATAAPATSAAPAASPTAAAAVAASAPPGSAPATPGASTDVAAPSPAAIFFGKKCGGCHSIGEGDRTGPDLLNVQKRRDQKWIITFIRSAGAVIDGGDSVATALVTKFNGMRMPDQLVGDTEMTALLAYFAECDTKGGCKIATGQTKRATEATLTDIATGESLFDGTTELTNGGPACISCHNVRNVGILGGGTLAKDLTFAYSRLGDAGLGSALETMPFPLMKDVFANQALTPKEAFQLKAFLYSVSRDGSQPASDHNFFYLGFCGLGVSLGLIGAAWSGRLRGGLRRKFIANVPVRAQKRGAS